MKQIAFEHGFDPCKRPIFFANCKTYINKAGYTVLEKVTKASGQEQYAQKAQKRLKSNSRKSVRWSAVPVAPM